jgi:Arc/MetJ family transcription regulator
MAATGLTTKKATVEEALRRLVRRYHRQNALADMTDLGWEGDLDTMREGREAGQNS